MSMLAASIVKIEKIKKNNHNKSIISSSLLPLLLCISPTGYLLGLKQGS